MANECTDWQARAVQTVEQVAAILGLHPSTVRDGIKDEAIPSIRCGRRILVPTAALQKLLHLPVQQTAPLPDLNEALADARKRVSDSHLTLKGS